MPSASKVGGAGPDKGCNANFPACFGDFHQAGTSCARCINDQAGNAPDSGCGNANSPICVGPLGQPGTECARCINDQASDLTRDTGCTDAARSCTAPLGQPGTSCCAPTYVKKTFAGCARNFAYAKALETPDCILSPIRNQAEFNSAFATTRLNDECWVGISKSAADLAASEATITALGTTPAPTTETQRLIRSQNWKNPDGSSVPISGISNVATLNTFWWVSEPNNDQSAGRSQPVATMNFGTNGRMFDAFPESTYTCGVYYGCGCTP